MILLQPKTLAEQSLQHDLSLHVHVTFVLAAVFGSSSTALSLNALAVSTQQLRTTEAFKRSAATNFHTAVAVELELELKTGSKATTEATNFHTAVSSNTPHPVIQPYASERPLLPPQPSALTSPSIVSVSNHLQHNFQVRSYFYFSLYCSPQLSCSPSNLGHNISAPESADIGTPNSLGL